MNRNSESFEPAAGRLGGEKKEKSNNAEIAELACSSEKSMNAPADSEQRVIRVFVSSTSRDMHAEREELVKRIFPQLRKLYESRGVVTVSSDNTALVWRADGTGEPMVLRAHMDKKRMLPNAGISVTSAAFSPDGTRIVTASSDKTARVAG